MDSQGKAGTPMRLWIAAGVLALPAFGAQEKPSQAAYPQDGVIWSRDWSEALTEARWRNVPVHVAYHDDSESSKTMSRTVYADPKFIEASRLWVNIPVHSRYGHEVEAHVGGTRVTVCERFWNIPCSAHVKHSKIAECFKDLEPRPVTIFTTTGIPVLGRLDGVATAAELLKAQEKVVAKWPGERVSALVWKDVKPVLDEGDRIFREKAWRKAIDTYLGIKKLKPKSLKELADERLDKVNFQGELIFGDAFKKTVPRATREEGKKMLRQIVIDFKPLKISKRAQDTLDSFHGD